MFRYMNLFHQEKNSRRAKEFEVILLYLVSPLITFSFSYLFPILHLNLTRGGQSGKHSRKNGVGIELGLVKKKKKKKNCHLVASARSLKSAQESIRVTKERMRT